MFRTSKDSWLLGKIIPYLPTCPGPHHSSPTCWKRHSRRPIHDLQITLAMDEHEDYVVDWHHYVFLRGDRLLNQTYHIISGQVISNHSPATSSHFKAHCIELIQSVTYTFTFGLTNCIKQLYWLYCQRPCTIYNLQLLKTMPGFISVPNGTNHAQFAFR